MIHRLTIWHVKAYCHQCHENKMAVAEFIKGMEKEVKHVTDFQTEIQLEQEINMLSMARRFQQTFDPASCPAPKVKKPKMIHTTEEGEEAKPAEEAEPEAETPPRVLTHEDVNMIITNKMLPF